MAEDKEQEKTEEESGLEEELEEPEEELEEGQERIDDDKFVEFLQPAEATSPVLEQVAVAHEFRATDLEQDISNMPVGVENNKKEEEEGEFKYRAGANQEEPKYISSERTEDREVVHHPPAVEMMSLGKQSPLLKRRETSFVNSSEARTIEPTNQEKYTSPARFDIDKAGKGKLFEKKDIKYEPST